jgi:hypothetical protein
MKLRNGKDTEKKRVRIREELSTNIFLYINKKIRKDYFKTSLTDYKINLIFRKEIMQQLKTEIETIEI